MSSKGSKRRVTVDTKNCEDKDKRKPSVFERLGAGSSEICLSDLQDREKEEVCKQYVITGKCPSGNACKLKHILPSTSEIKPQAKSTDWKDSRQLNAVGRRGDKCHGSSDPDIQERHSRLSRHPHGDQKRERRRDEEQGRPSSRSHHDKESKMKSAVVVKRSSGGQDSDDISEESLESKKEPELERKRLKLQHELSRLEAVERVGSGNRKAAASVSSSDGSPGLGRSGRKHSAGDKHYPHSGRSRKDERKHCTKSPSESSGREKNSYRRDKNRGHKKDDSADSTHRKRKKSKRERRHSSSLSSDSRSYRRKHRDEQFHCSGSRSHPEAHRSDRHSRHQSRTKHSCSDVSRSPSLHTANKKQSTDKKKSRVDSSCDNSPRSKKCLSSLRQTLKLKKAQPDEGKPNLPKLKSSPEKSRTSPSTSTGRSLAAEQSVKSSQSYDCSMDGDCVTKLELKGKKRSKKRTKQRQSDLLHRKNAGDGVDDSVDVHGRKCDDLSLKEMLSPESSHPGGKIDKRGGREGDEYVKTRGALAPQVKPSGQQGSEYNSGHGQDQGKRADQGIVEQKERQQAGPYYPLSDKIQQNAHPIEEQASLCRDPDSVTSHSRKASHRSSSRHHREDRRSKDPVDRVPTVRRSTDVDRSAQVLSDRADAARKRDVVSDDRHAVPPAQRDVDFRDSLKDVAGRDSDYARIVDGGKIEGNSDRGRRGRFGDDTSKGSIHGDVGLTKVSSECRPSDRSKRQDASGSRPDSFAELDERVNRGIVPLKQFEREKKRVDKGVAGKVTEQDSSAPVERPGRHRKRRRQDDQIGKHSPVQSSDFMDSINSRDCGDRHSGFDVESRMSNAEVFDASLNRHGEKKQRICQKWSREVDNAAFHDLLIDDLDSRDGCSLNANFRGSDVNRPLLPSPLVARERCGFVEHLSALDSRGPFIRSHSFDIMNDIPSDNRIDIENRRCIGEHLPSVSNHGSHLDSECFSRRSDFDAMCDNSGNLNAQPLLPTPLIQPSFEEHGTFKQGLHERIVGRRHRDDRYHQMVSQDDKFAFDSRDKHNAQELQYDDLNIDVSHGSKTYSHRRALVNSESVKDTNISEHTQLHDTAEGSKSFDSVHGSRTYSARESLWSAKSASQARFGVSESPQCVRDHFSHELDQSTQKDTRKFLKEQSVHSEQRGRYRGEDRSFSAGCKYTEMSRRQPSKSVEENSLCVESSGLDGNGQKRDPAFDLKCSQTMVHMKHGSASQHVGHHDGKRTAMVSQERCGVTPNVCTSEPSGHIRSIKPQSPVCLDEALHASNSRCDHRERSRTPGVRKRRRDDEQYSSSKMLPRGSDCTRSPVFKRAREASRSPGHWSSRHSSPVGSHHSYGSARDVKRRQQNARVFGQSRDCPALKISDNKCLDTGRMENSAKVIPRKYTRSPFRRMPAKHEGDGKRGGGVGDGVVRHDGYGRWDGGDREKQGDAAPSTSSRTLPTGVPGGDLTDVDQGDVAQRQRRHCGSDERRALSRERTLDGDFKRMAVDNPDGKDDEKDSSLQKMLYDDDDYEKISSDEGSDFEDVGERQSQSIVSLLDIDWASLARSTPSRPATGSLMKRFQPAAVFSEIGISRALAGDNLYNMVQQICSVGGDQLDGDEKTPCRDVSLGRQPAGSDGLAVRHGGVPVTGLLAEEPVQHVSTVRQRAERGQLFDDVGRFRRALCARRDLDIRRQLCKVDSAYDQPVAFQGRVVTDTALCNLSVQLFYQGRDDFLGSKSFHARNVGLVM